MSKKNWVPDRGEMIWIDHSPQSGREMREKHPMLVLSPKKFNDKTGLVIGLPMTTASSNDSNPFAVKFYNQEKNKTSYVLTHQPKSFDWRERGASVHPWKKVPLDVFSASCELLNQIIVLSE